MSLFSFRLVCIAPADQSIIKNLKTHYRKRILHKIIQGIEQSKGRVDVSVNLREYIE